MTDPYTIAEMLGGISNATEPLEVIKPVVNPLGYFFSIILGYIRPPMAITVAGEEPDTAPKNIQATSVVMAMPPVLPPTMVWAQFKIRFAIPPVFITFAPKIKKGIAMRENLSTPPTMRCTTIISG
ncbi:hypothetical protein SDC9_140334 [bioreactor metagenome]|uniref:Uncharacterized protein n=1 Tax=bioreactor metagenome TaxID=1076179 RepID=A0A645DVQ0_9ZZZZ